MKTNPINCFHDIRRMMYSVYERDGFDKAIELLKAKRMPHTFRAGIHAELLFYDKYGSKLELEPLLDAGVKADFNGRKKNYSVNFDVTTNLDYKDINKYVDVMQKRRKRYEIVFVNLKTEEVLFYPLRFPICSYCNKFAHYILYLVPSTSKTMQAAKISTEQSTLRYCSHCGRYEDLNRYSYMIRSLFDEMEELRHEEDVDEGPRYSEKQILDIRNKEAISIVKFFERRSRLLLSALAENRYLVTDIRDGSGEWLGGIGWKHPLAKDLGKAIDVYFGEWELNLCDTEQS